jgi:hypothetical protein
MFILYSGPPTAANVGVAVAAVLLFLTVSWLRCPMKKRLDRREWFGLGLDR